LTPTFKPTPDSKLASILTMDNDENILAASHVFMTSGNSRNQIQFIIGEMSNA